MPVEFTVTFRPTPSIAQPQETIDLETMTNTKITIGGRHDACIALRAPVVVESAAGLGPVETEGRRRRAENWTICVVSWTFWTQS